MLILSEEHLISPVTQITKSTRSQLHNVLYEWFHETCNRFNASQNPNSVEHFVNQDLSLGCCNLQYIFFYSQIITLS